MFDPFTLVGFHTWLSLIGLITGVIVSIGLIRAQSSPLWTALFLVTAVATDATGYVLPASHILPSHIVAAISLVALALAIVSRYRFHRVGAWRWIYPITTVMALYFLVFVGIAQAFLKIPALHALAPTGSEPPFAIAQLIALVLFVLLGIATVRASHSSNSNPA